MESLLLMLFGTLLLMFFVKKHLNKATRGTHLPAALIEPTTPWIYEDCPCGIQRDDWTILAANSGGLRFLLLCPGCGRKWEEGTLGGRARWREVSDEYAESHFELK